VTLESPWNAFDLPETEEVRVTDNGLALSYPGHKTGPFDRALTTAGWSRTALARGEAQSTSTWERDGWVLAVNTAPSRRTDVLDVRMGIVGIPETERWTELALPIGPGRIVRSNGRELALMFDAAPPDVVFAAEQARLEADGWALGATRSARTMFSKAGQPAIIVWAEPTATQVLMHITWGGPPAEAAVETVVETPSSPIAGIPAQPLVEPWLGLGLPIGDGVVAFADSTVVSVIYDHGSIDRLFDDYDSDLVAEGWAQTFVSRDAAFVAATYARDAKTLTVAVTEASGMWVVALTVL
jgi:hypothetical protein